MNKTTFFFILSVFLLFSGCSSSSSDEIEDYETLVEMGMASKDTNNTLFLGYELGMTREDFREHSWQLNKEEVISGLVKIDYPFDGLKENAMMTFFPDFKNNRISKMPVEIHYEKWAPWNSEFSSDTLMIDLVNYYESHYETQFHELFVPHLDKNAYVSVEGNRAITVSRHNDMIALVEFIDLNAANRP